MPAAEPTTWLTAADLAAMLQVSEKTISRWTLTASLPALRIGKVTRYERARVARTSAAGYQQEADVDARVCLTYQHNPPDLGSAAAVVLVEFPPASRLAAS